MLYEYRKQQLRNNTPSEEYDITDEMASPAYYYPIPKKNQPEPDYQGRFSYMPNNPHLGAPGILFEKRMFQGLELIGLGGLFRENRTNGALWDIFFEQNKVWNSLFRKRYANIKNFNTPWVASVGSLNTNLPWNTPNTKTNDELKAIILRWIKKTEFHKLILLKPLSEQVEHSIIHSIQTYQKNYLVNLFTEKNWLAAFLGDDYDIDLKRRDDGGLYSFSIVRGRLPKVISSQPAPRLYTPRQLSFGRNWLREELGAESNRFVYTEPVAQGTMGFFIGGKGIFRHQINILQPGYDRAILHTRG